MKALIYSDVHISQDSSIVKSFGTKYSTRLEYIIKSLNWAEQLADERQCDAIFNLGDTFDKPFINAMEATATQDVKWSPLPHYVIVGNHDSDVASLEYSSVSILKKSGFDIITQPAVVNDIGLLPYCLEKDRKPLSETFSVVPKVIFSHNDLAGVDFGHFLSGEGYRVDDIESHCDLFLNGHLHNTAWVTKKILNVGNLCGQNFSEDGFTYKHGCWILDTNTLTIEFVENPFALNFYKLEYPKDKNFIVSNTSNTNKVITIRVERKDVQTVKDLIDNNHSIVASRVVVYDKDVSKYEEVKLEKIDHLKTFVEFVKEKLGNSELVNDELAEVCK